MMVVGIGASAGGLDALRAFFAHMPGGHGLAFVVVTHHHPKTPSLLPQLLARYTRMPVVEAEHEMEVLPERVHVIPPGAGAVLERGRILLDGERTEGRLVRPIDIFFQSLARERGSQAMAVILSGSGHDGSLGAAEIRRAGGFTIAQDAAAAYPEMPENAIATGGIAQVLPVEACGAAILGHLREAPAKEQPAAVDQSGVALASIIDLVRDATGHDLSHYKESITRRRVARRMMLRRIASLAEYVRALEADPAEILALWQDMLIGVTSFFRNAAGFEALGKALDALLAAKPEGETVRAWVAGCSTGEEAFSIAIALRESMQRIGRSFPLRVLATDLDLTAIEVAKAGVFPEGAVAEIGRERLNRFFVRQPGRYAIHPDILGAVEFSARTLLESPFEEGERVDLASCRNVLIYLTTEAQQEILSALAAALRPGGLLFLGRSERLGLAGNRFEPVSPPWRIFRRVDRAPRPELPTPQPVPATLAAGGGVRRGSFADLVAGEYAPPSVLVNAGGDILQLHGPLSRYLEPPNVASASTNLLHLARSGLQGEVALAIRSAAQSGQLVIRRAVQFLGAEGLETAEIRARRIDVPEELAGLVLVSFLSPAPATAPPDTLALQQQLQIVNQELTSMNDELRAVNLGLESSLEALTARLDDLEAANAELTARIAELDR